MDLHQRIRVLLPQLAKFFTSSLLATGVDYALFLFLDWAFLGPVAAHAISYPIAVLVNFALQKHFIFSMNRKMKEAFALAMLFSGVGWALGTGMLYLLVMLPLFSTIPVLAKLLVTIVLFFFNFFTKRFAFERRFFETN